MIAYKGRESRRSKLKTAKVMEKLFKEKKCRECSVVVTKMDFAKILGKFTKVKIQYESSSPKSKKSVEVTSPKPNARLKNNENGMVQIPRNINNKQLTKNIHNQKKNKFKDVSSPSIRNNNNILKENNLLKKTVTPNITKINGRKQLSNDRKQYGIIFDEPADNKSNDIRNELRLADLLPYINDNILPSKEWRIDYFPRAEELKADKVYDRIAAELEDLMCSDKPIQKQPKPEAKVDDFPSIMDILNDTNVNKVDVKDQNNSLEYKSNLDSSDVEAMLLGKTNSTDQAKEPEPMELDNSCVNKLNSDENLTEEEKPKNVEEKPVTKDTNVSEIPASPSLLEETLQKGIEEQLPPSSQIEIPSQIATPSESEEESKVSSDPIDESKSEIKPNDTPLSETTQSGVSDIPEQAEVDNLFPLTHIDNIRYITFKIFVNGKCSKAVTCPKNLKYSIELDSKPVEFLGAPKYITSIDDLKVLLQIVQESSLQNLYVFQ